MVRLEQTCSGIGIEVPLVETKDILREMKKQNGMDSVRNPRVSVSAMHHLSWIGLAFGETGQGSSVQLRTTVDFQGLLSAFPEVC